MKHTHSDETRSFLVEHTFTTDNDSLTVKVIERQAMEEGETRSFSVTDVVLGHRTYSMQSTDHDLASLPKTNLQLWKAAGRAVKEEYKYMLRRSVADGTVLSEAREKYERTRGLLKQATELDLTIRAAMPGRRKRK